jgi:hypothetical protein
LLIRHGAVPLELSLLKANVISIHRHPRPLLHTITRLAVAMGLSAVVLSIPLQLILAFTIAPLLLGTSVFTILLTVPLLILSVLHPEIRVTETGLRLMPMLWRAQSIGWETLSTLTDHPLIYEDPVLSRHLYGKQYRLREGKVIVLSRDAPVLWMYRLLGLFSGVGLTPAFGISSTTHTDYESLLQTIQARLPHVDSPN